MSASTSPVQLLDDRDLTLGPGSYVYYPAVRPDGRGNAVVVFGYSSQADYPSVGVATKPAQGPWNQWLPLAAGTATQTSGRWGDYFAAAIDPAVSGRVWVSGQVGAEVAGTPPGPRLGDDHRLGDAVRGPARGCDVPDAEGPRHHEDVGDDLRLGRPAVRRDDLPVRVRQDHDAVPIRDPVDAAPTAAAADDRQRDAPQPRRGHRSITTGSSPRTPSERRPATTGRSRRSRSRNDVEAEDEPKRASSAAPRAPARRACRASRAASPSPRAPRCR